jgi:hypothetical protein
MNAILPAKSLGVEWIEVSALNVRKHQFHWSELELVGSQEHYRHFERLILLHDQLTSVVRGVVHHYDSVLSPVIADSVHMVAELD